MRPVRVRRMRCWSTPAMRGDYRPLRPPVNRDTTVVPGRVGLSHRCRVSQRLSRASAWHCPCCLTRLKGRATTLRDDRGLGFTVLAAAAFAVVLAGCSFFGGSTKETWATAHPAKAPATEPTPQPSAMAERAQAAGAPPARLAPRAEAA